MILAIQSCDKDVIKELESMGYDTVDFDSQTSYADAILYRGHLSNTFESSICGRDNGIFIINASGKTAAEIDNILQKRLYSPFFSM